MSRRREQNYEIRRLIASISNQVALLETRVERLETRGRSSRSHNHRPCPLKGRTLIDRAMIDPGMPTTPNIVPNIPETPQSENGLGKSSGGLVTCEGEPLKEEEDIVAVVPESPPRRTHDYTTLIPVRVETSERRPLPAPMKLILHEIGRDDVSTLVKLVPCLDDIVTAKVAKQPLVNKPYVDTNIHRVIVVFSVEVVTFMEPLGQRIRGRPKVLVIMNALPETTWTGAGCNYLRAPFDPGVLQGENFFSLPLSPSQIQEMRSLVRRTTDPMSLLITTRTKERTQRFFVVANDGCLFVCRETCSHRRAKRGGVAFIPATLHELRSQRPFNPGIAPRQGCGNDEVITLAMGEPYYH